MNDCCRVYQRTPDGWKLRLIHPKCPAHGDGSEWKAVA